MVKTEIYIGLNDQDTKEQKFETSKYIDVLKKVCVNYQVPFSLNVIDGGYIHETGEYTEEKSLVLTLLDVDRKTIREIAKDLCMFFHQESVLITSGAVKAYSIRDEAQDL